MWTYIQQATHSDGETNSDCETQRTHTHTHIHTAVCEPWRQKFQTHTYKHTQSHTCKENPKAQNRNAQAPTDTHHSLQFVPDTHTCTCTHTHTHTHTHTVVCQMTVWDCLYSIQRPGRALLPNNENKLSVYFVLFFYKYFIYFPL